MDTEVVCREQQVKGGGGGRDRNEMNLNVTRVTSMINVEGHQIHALELV